MRNTSIFQLLFVANCLWLFGSVWGVFIDHQWNRVFPPSVIGASKFGNYVRMLVGDVVIFVGINGAGDIFSLGYSRNLAADDVEYTVYVSTDLETWHTGDGYVAVTNERIPRPDGTTDVTVSSLLPADEHPRQFMKLQVTLR